MDSNKANSSADEDYPHFSDREYAQRKSLYKHSIQKKGSLYITYKRMYIAAEWVGRFGWILDLFTAIIGSVLLYLLTRDSLPNLPIIRWIASFEPADLTILILLSSLLSSFYGPKLRSRDYYIAGQEMQELYDEFDRYIHIDLLDPDHKLGHLDKKFKYLNDRRHNLNQSTPQIGGLWYKMMNVSKYLRNVYNKLHPSKTVSEWSEPDFSEKISHIRR